jgi:hypothetical protein
MTSRQPYLADPRIIELGPDFYDAVEPADFPKAVPRFLNRGWAEKVGLDGHVKAGRLGIAIHKGNPSIGYVLGAGPHLWRIDNKTARRVRNIPTQLFGETADDDQSHYDLAIAVHPTDPNQVIVGGSTVKAEQTLRLVDGEQKLRGGNWAASLFRLAITGTAAADNFFCDFNQDNQTHPGTDTGTYIGPNVHADVHTVRYTGNPDGSQVWVGCDGGAYRSAQNGDAYTFIPRNNGLAVVEPGFLANHPTNDGPVIIGTQDGRLYVLG